MLITYTEVLGNFGAMLISGASIESTRVFDLSVPAGGMRRETRRL